MKLDSIPFIADELGFSDLIGRVVMLPDAGVQMVGEVPGGIGRLLGAGVNLVEHLLGQLRYAIDLVGAEHVGLGLDVFDRMENAEYVRGNPTLFSPGIDAAGGMGMFEPEAVGPIAEGLARVNLTDAEIRGILGENWLRIARQVWR